MSDAPAPDNKAKEAEAAPKKGGGGAGLVLGLVLPALLAAGASYGGSRAAARAPAPHAEAHPHAEVKPPGPTLTLEPFLVSVVDANKKGHPMKLSVAVEFGATVKEDTLKSFVPRIRDAILAYMRTLSYEDAVDSHHAGKLREELLERCQKAGAASAEKILITDMVSQ